MRHNRYRTPNLPTDFLGKVEQLSSGSSQNTLIRPELSWKGEALSTRYGDWREISQNDELDPKRVFVLIGYAGGSDYSGNLVEVSNYKALVEMCEAQEEPELVAGVDYLEYTGGCGTFALAVRVGAMGEELLEAIESLADYPLLDESLHSELEIESQNEAWCEHGCREDFKRDLERVVASELEAQMPDDEWGNYWPYVDWVKDGDWMDGVEDSTVDGWAYKLQEIANVYWENEEGSGSWIDTERMATALIEEIKGHRDWSKKAQREVMREVRESLSKGWARAWWGQFGIEERKAN